MARVSNKMSHVLSLRLMIVPGSCGLRMTRGYAGWKWPDIHKG
jgi:hypothetical protein